MVLGRGDIEVGSWSAISSRNFEYERQRWIQVSQSALLNKFHVLELANSGKNVAEISSQTNQSVDFVERTLCNRNGIVKCSTPKAKR